MSDLREQSYEEFVCLLAGCDPRIRRFVRSLMPTAEGVDDVVQETALECWKKYADFQSDHSAHTNPPQQDIPSEPPTADRTIHHDRTEEFLRWACVIARYKVLSWQRDHSRDRLVFQDDVVQQLADRAVDRLPQVERHRAAVDQCLQTLDDEQRTLVLAVHQRGQSIAALARESGRQARQLYTQLNALRRRLADCVTRRLTTESSHG
ncbi:MAG: sigma-70 family RNA polymerase sigma factor [Fuerstiella sp.]